MMKHRILGLLLVVFLVTAFKSEERLPTSLKITILNELGNIEEGATVTLYLTDEDYRAEQNPVMDSQVTDKKGRVTFKKLEPKVYFAHAEKGDKNNDGAGVQTDVLKEGLLNKVTIIIE